MSSPQIESRVIVSPSRGSRLAVGVALLLAVVAAYILVVPLEVATKEGPPFFCGSGLQPQEGDFPRSVCGGANDRARLAAGALGASAIVVLGIGFWAFGTQRRIERRLVDDGGESNQRDEL